MATPAKETLKELRETGRLVLHAPVLVAASECAIHFLLGAMLSGAEIFGGYAPFGLAMVGCAGAGLDGVSALLGACLGYLTFQGFTQGLRYAAAAILIFAVSFAFYDLKLCRKAWFMPVITALMDGVTGFVYLSKRGWFTQDSVFFLTELLLVGAAAYFYRIALAPWKKKREEVPLSMHQLVSMLILGGTVLITLSGIHVLWNLSLGRLLATLVVMVTAYQLGVGPGAAVGVLTGLAMDIANLAPFYSMAYGFAGVMAGVFRKQGRLFTAITYVMANAVAVLWTYADGLQISILYEVFVASVAFMVLPETFLRRVGALVAPEPKGDTARKAQSYLKARLGATSAAFRSLYDALRTAFPPPEHADADASAIFDRAADKVCRRCPLQTSCWQKEYVTTFNALNDALAPMLERGRGEGGDFPVYFSSRCIHFPAFLTAANEEVAALLHRRQYRARLRESRASVCRQYGVLADVLEQAAAEFSSELISDGTAEPPLMAVAGVAARKKDGQTVSGDTGAWFKLDDGSLYILLCDGMGSGQAAHEDSTLAAKLLEQFLRAGVSPDSALRTLSGALALRGEEQGGFTTIDLLRVNLFTGEAAVYKYGAAPTYLRTGGKVTKFTGSALPAGLASGESAPDKSVFHMEAGDCVLLVSDGLTGGGEDVWLREQLLAFAGDSPKDLARAILDESERRDTGVDDRTALVIRLSERQKNSPS